MFKLIPETLPTQCQQAFPDAYTIIQMAYPKNRVRNSSKNYFSGTVWHRLELISNNILMVNLMVNFLFEIVYPFKNKWIKSSFTIEWE